MNARPRSEVEITVEAMHRARFARNSKAVCNWRQARAHCRERCLTRALRVSVVRARSVCVAVPMRCAKVERLRPPPRPRSIRSRTRHRWQSASRTYECCRQARTTSLRFRAMASARAARRSVRRSCAQRRHDRSCRKVHGSRWPIWIANRCSRRAHRMSNAPESISCITIGKPMMMNVIGNNSAISGKSIFTGA